MRNSSGDAVLIQTETGAVARLVLNRPGSGNSLSAALIAALRAALADLEARREIKVIIVSGGGGRVFCAGHDLSEFALGNSDHDFSDLTSLMKAIMVQRQIVIAKVEGIATAAGCELVAACDLALASTRARFAVPGINIGFWCHSP